jgi:tetratricopeptide (TPR) repeat protein
VWEQVNDEGNGDTLDSPSKQSASKPFSPSTLSDQFSATPLQTLSLFFLLTIMAKGKSSKSSSSSKKKKTVVDEKHPTTLEAEAGVDGVPDVVDNTPVSTQQLKGEAAALEGSRQFEKALEKYDEVLARQQRTIGDSHEDTVDTMYCISRVLEEMKSISAESNAKDMERTSMDLYHQGRHGEGLIIDQQRFDLLMKSKGEDHPDTLEAQFNVARSLSQLYRYDQSLALYEKVLAKAKVVMGIDDPLTLDTMHSVAFELMKVERNEESLTILEDVIERRSHWS